jgi:hypothetical protein
MSFRRLVSAALVAGAVLAAGTAARAQVAPADRRSGPVAASPSSSGPQAAEEKSAFVALAWELIPGAGSLYAEDVPGAVATWALIVGGTGAAIWGISMLSFPDADPQPHHESALAMPLLLGGLGLAVYGRIHGFVSAYAAAERYNAALAPPAVSSSLSFAPYVTANGGPGLLLGGRF